MLADYTTLIGCYVFTHKQRRYRLSVYVQPVSCRFTLRYDSTLTSFSCCYKTSRRSLPTFPLLFYGIPRLPQRLSFTSSRPEYIHLASIPCCIRIQDEMKAE